MYVGTYVSMCVSMCVYMYIYVCVAAANASITTNSNMTAIVLVASSFSIMLLMDCCFGCCSYAL
ncbi:hypothetical protein BDF19DRAFT_438972 [Syncephalis fuscata]|nr:hypothetical protein BDF19DRAFT_438972 [Syncephalis fuscata]